MQGCRRARRDARYRCVVVFVEHADDPQPLVGEGTWEGSILDGRRGTGGFGYDPAFVPRGDTRTVAEMPTDEKHQLSHRGQALRAFLAASGDGARRDQSAARAVRPLSVVRAEVPVLRFQLLHAQGAAARGSVHRHVCDAISTRRPQASRDAR
jgi:hypothetical protein